MSPQDGTNFLKKKEMKRLNFLYINLKENVVLDRAQETVEGERRPGCILLWRKLPLFQGNRGREKMKGMEGRRKGRGGKEGEEEEGMISRGKRKREGEKGRGREEGKKEKVEETVVGWKGRKKGEKDESETFSHSLLPLLISLFCCSEPWVPAVC